ncbi:hypothetical protein ELI_4469 [Eubacterium callanderi]|uniref:Uncharacterized protein n=1 Tax=Eubacterium callanderi TaxID=53442 RepID=E3GQW1_9FIRM|nr:hypothetical protein ELI_4469 [Eubacterium callanderi]
MQKSIKDYQKCVFSEKSMLRQRLKSLAFLQKYRFKNNT